MASPQGDGKKKPPKVPPKPLKLYRSLTVAAPPWMPEKSTARFNAGIGPSEALDAPVSQKKEDTNLTFVQTQISDLNKNVTSFNHLIATKESENGTLMQKIGQLADTVMEMHKLQFDLCQQFHIQCEEINEVKLLPSTGKKLVPDVALKKLPQNIDSVMKSFKLMEERIQSRLSEISSNSVKGNNDGDQEFNHLSKQIIDHQKAFDEERIFLKSKISVLEDQKASLETALKREKHQLGHLTDEVHRLISLRKKKQIASLKRKLSSTLDMHRVMIEHVEERTSELERERKHRIRQAQDYQKCDGLEMKLIQDVKMLKENIGAGSYGSVSLIKVNGTPCIMKNLHSILLGIGKNEKVSQDQKTSLKTSFYRECNLLWKLNHPNIVQFMGVHFYGPNNDYLALIMEYLPIDLDELISMSNKTNATIPLGIKLSILRDIAYGLCELHSNSVVHRDLSASNVLLTPSLQAKIADFGMSKLLTAEARIKLTCHPGTNYVMPPEAFEEKPNYSIEMDIFSFGALCLYAIVQKCPIPMDSTLDAECVQSHKIAIGRRKTYLNKAKEICKPMEKLATECLYDLPGRRPTAQALVVETSKLIQEAKLEIWKDMITILQITSLGSILMMSPEVRYKETVV